MMQLEMCWMDGTPIERMNPDDAELKRREEEKRDRAYDPAQRWIHIQQTITWPEANMPPEQRRNRPRTRAERNSNAESPKAPAE